MKHLITTLFLMLFIAGTAYCQTKAEMNKEAAEDYKKADAELNKVYQQIMKECSGDPTFLDALRTPPGRSIRYDPTMNKCVRTERE